MRILSQDNDTIQEFADRIFLSVPIILSTDSSTIYILVKDLPANTEKFILTGEIGNLEHSNNLQKKHKNKVANLKHHEHKEEGAEEDVDLELHVLQEEDEWKFVEKWRKQGFKCAIGSQHIEYMNRDVSIRYLRVRNPTTNMSVSIIPWFMLYRKPYPITAYAYGIWYYLNNEKKDGLRKTANVVKKIFGLQTFDASTVYRSICQMSELYAEINEKALQTTEAESVSITDIIDLTTDILKNHATVESVEEAYGIKAANYFAKSRQCDSQSINNAANFESNDLAEPDSSTPLADGISMPAETTVPLRQARLEIAHIFDNVPGSLLKVTKAKTPIKIKRSPRKISERRDGKWRPPKKSMTIDFVESQEIEKKRIEFTRICKNMVLNAANIYHKLLI